MKVRAGYPLPSSRLLWTRACAHAIEDDPALAAEALVPLTKQVLAEEMAARGEVIDPAAIHRARTRLRRHLATQLRAQFNAVWHALAPLEPYAPDGVQVGRRALRNHVWAIWRKVTPNI